MTSKLKLSVALGVIVSLFSIVSGLFAVDDRYIDTVEAAALEEKVQVAFEYQKSEVLDNRRRLLENQIERYQERLAVLLAKSDLQEWERREIVRLENQIRKLEREIEGLNNAGAI